MGSSARVQKASSVVVQRRSMRCQSGNDAVRRHGRRSADSAHLQGQSANLAAPLDSKIGYSHLGPGGGMAYAGDLKSPASQEACGFDPHPGHQDL